MADISARSLALVDGYGAGYRPTGTPASPRYTIPASAKVIKDNGNGTATITLTVTLKTNSGWAKGGFVSTLHFSCAGKSNSVTWKESSTNWNQNSTYSKSISLTIDLDGQTTKSADLWLTMKYYAENRTEFTFRSSQQGGDQITGIPVGYQVSTFTAMSNFNSNASSIPLTVRRRTAGMTNRLTLKIGGTTIETWSRLGDVNSVSLSSENNTALANAIPNSTTATATMLMETLNGSTVIGSVTRTSTCTVPSSLGPTLTSITAADTVSAVVNLMGSGVYVQNMSIPRFTLNGAAAGQGASISKREIIFNGKTYTSSPATATLLTGSSAITATGKITDSRGYTVSKTVTITPISYSTPRLSSVQTRRATNTSGTVDDEGIYLRVDRSISISALNNKNRMTLKIEHKLSTSSTWTQTYSNQWAAGTNSNSTATIISSPTFTIASSYDIRITLTDLMGNSVIAMGSLGTAKHPLVVGPEGIGVGRVPTPGVTLDVGGPANIAGLMNMLGGIQMTSVTNLDTTYTSGYYAYANTTTGRPSNYGVVEVYVSHSGTWNNSNNWLYQKAYGTDGDNYIRRRINNGSWHPWQRVWDGLAVTTHGTDSNRAWRFPNGLQISAVRITHNSQNVSTAWGNWYESGEKSGVNYTVPFIAAPAVSYAVSGSVHGLLSTGGGNATTTPKYAILRPTSITGANYVVMFTAVGRWK